MRRRERNVTLDLKPYGTKNRVSVLEVDLLFSFITLVISFKCIKAAPLLRASFSLIGMSFSRESSQKSNLMNRKYNNSSSFDWCHDTKKGRISLNIEIHVIKPGFSLILRHETVIMKEFMELTK